MSSKWLQLIAKAAKGAVLPEGLYQIFVDFSDQLDFDKVRKLKTSSGVWGHVSRWLRSSIENCEETSQKNVDGILYFALKLWAEAEFPERDDLEQLMREFLVSVLPESPDSDQEVDRFLMEQDLSREEFSSMLWEDVKPFLPKSVDLRLAVQLQRICRSVGDDREDPERTPTKPSRSKPVQVRGGQPSKLRDRVERFARLGRRDHDDSSDSDSNSPKHSKNKKKRSEQELGSFYSRLSTLLKSTAQILLECVCVCVLSVCVCVCVSIFNYILGQGCLF